MEAKDLMLEIELALKDYFEISEERITLRRPNALEFELLNGEGFRLTVIKTHSNRLHKLGSAAEQNLQSETDK